MPRTLPRTARGLQRMTTVLLLCLLGLAFGSPNRRDKERHNKGRNRGQIPAAHLEAVTPINGSLIWTNNTESSFVHGDLSLINNEVHINQKGLYFVYTQATFNIIACSRKNSFLLSHAVILKSIRQGDIIQLLQAQKTACEEKNMDQYKKSLFQGGVFQLEKDDVLYTHTSDMSYLMGQDGTTYFGLYAL